MALVVPLNPMGGNQGNMWYGICQGPMGPPRVMAPGPPGSALEVLSVLRLGTVGGCCRGRGVLGAPFGVFPSLGELAE